MPHNLLLAAGALASAFHAKAPTATLCAHLIHVSARLARTAKIKLPAHPARQLAVAARPPGLVRSRPPLVINTLTASVYTAL
ncbi:hypothetical protein [Streptomyces griseorubiginosus]|uniref:hypothetical protein n=1 Tax=Streptomyces griseorubiginosus TaxID=67304 RepID=UPI00131C31CA|nr:hypothetical protein [Streptomyces griseorubiginosus]